MSRPSANPKRILAIHPASRGFGYAVLESLTTLVDWGVKATRQNKQVQTLAKVADLIRHYRPEMLVLEDCAGNKSRRCPRIQSLLDSMRAQAAKTGVTSRNISPEQVRRVFLTFGARTKYQIAHAIARQLPELAHRLPRYRKPWMSEDYSMAIFDAVALALTYFYSRELRSRKLPAPLSP